MQVNIQQAMADANGQRGVSRRKLSLIREELTRAETELAEAMDASMLPFACDIEEKQGKAVQFRRRYMDFSQICIVAESAIVQSFQLIVANTALASKMLWIDSLDPMLSHTLHAVSSENRLTIVCMGPKWVSQFVQIVQPSEQNLWLCVGDGTEGTDNVPENATANIIQEEGISDPRFAMFSSIGLSLHEDISSAVRVLQQSIHDIQKQGMWENQSSLFASSIVAMDSANFPTQLILVGARSSWHSWFGWANSVWMGMTSYVLSYGGVAKSVDGRLVHFILGDELGMNTVVANNNSMVCLFEEGIPLVAQPSDMDIALWEASQQQVDQFVLFAQSHTIPLVNIRVSKLSKEELLRLSVRWVHAALMVNAVRGVDPLSMWGADQWRLVDVDK